MSALEDETTERLAPIAGTFAPATSVAERKRDIASLRALVRKYGKFVEWAAAQLDVEPEREALRTVVAEADAEIARRLANSEALSGRQIRRHVMDIEPEQTPDRLAWWIEHALERAATCTGAEGDLVDLLLAVVVLLGRCNRCRPRLPRETTRAWWERVAALNTTTHSGLRRELKRQGVIT